MKITEVFFRSTERKPGQQWFEIFNDGEKSINLQKAVIRRIDGKLDPQQNWALVLPDVEHFLEAGQYAVIAQRADLGLNLCSEHLVIVIEDPTFNFKSEGVQNLCIKTTEQAEVCERINDSKGTRKGRSRDFSESSWRDAECQLKPGIFASPGLLSDFCKQNSDSGWTTCPDPIAAATQQTVHHTSGCQVAILDSQSAFLCFGMSLCVLSLRKALFRKQWKGFLSLKACREGPYVKCPQNK